MLNPIPLKLSVKKIAVSFDLAKAHLPGTDGGQAIAASGRLKMARIERIEMRLVDIPPKVRRTDAIQSFVSQETPMMTVTDSDGRPSGRGYGSTIGTGGSIGHAPPRRPSGA